MESSCRVLLLDDYNGRIYDGEIVGTVRQTFGVSALRNGWKIIEETDLAEPVQRRAVSDPLCGVL